MDNLQVKTKYKLIGIQRCSQAFKDAAQDCIQNIIQVHIRVE